MTTEVAEVFERNLRLQLGTAEYDNAVAGIDAKEETTLERLREYTKNLNSPLKWGPFIGHSGGKDSVAITHLADKVWSAEQLPVVHTPKASTHPATVQFLYKLAQQRSVQYIPASKQMPYNLRVQIDGTRIAESDRVDGRSTDVVINGVSTSRTNLKFFVECGLFGLSFLYPIFDWSDADVWAYILRNNLPFSQEYTW